MRRTEYEIGDLVRIFCEDDVIQDVWVHRGKVGVIIDKELSSGLKYFIYTVSMGNDTEVFEDGDLMPVYPRVTEYPPVLQ